MVQADPPAAMPLPHRCRPEASVTTIGELAHQVGPHRVALSCLCVRRPGPHRRATTTTRCNVVCAFPACRLSCPGGVAAAQGLSRRRFCRVAAPVPGWLRAATVGTSGPAARRRPGDRHRRGTGERGPRRHHHHRQRPLWCLVGTSVKCAGHGGLGTAQNEGHCACILIDPAATAPRRAWCTVLCRVYSMACRRLPCRAPQEQQTGRLPCRRAQRRARLPQQRPSGRRNRLPVGPVGVAAAVACFEGCCGHLG